jgi:hypothetical protein
MRCSRCRGGLRVLGAVVEGARLAGLAPRQALALRRARAFQLIRDEDPGPLEPALEQFTAALLRGLLLSSALPEDIEDVAGLLHGAPAIMARCVHGEEHLIQMPLVAWPGTLASEWLGILRAELAAPLPERFGGDAHATDAQEFFYITGAERKAAIQPDRRADDGTRASRRCVRIRRGCGRHGRSTPEDGCLRRAHSSREARRRWHK